MPDTAHDKPKPKRRWFQFRLKTLFIVVAVLCVPLAWVGVRMNQKRHERAVIAELEQLGGMVMYEWQGKREDGVWQPENWRTGDPPGPLWIHQIFGDDFFSHVVYVALLGSPANDDDLQMVATIRGLETLDLPFAEIGDAGLAHLKGLASLRCLDLSHTDITDVGLGHLKSLVALKHLRLNGTNTTNAAVDDLAKALPGCKIYRPYP